MADKVVLTVGTKRGLFLLESNSRRARWKIRGPFLKGWPIYYAMIDTRGTPRLHVAASSDVYASTTFSADISAQKLKGAATPPVPPKLTAKQTRDAKQWGINTTSRLWVIEPGPANQKKLLYAGSAPAGLFRSEDSGKSWEGVKGINEHKTRKNWAPGFGGMSLHSIQIDPTDPNRMYVAISAGGAFRTDDGGQTWASINNEVAEYVGAPKESLVGT